MAIALCKFPRYLDTAFSSLFLKKQFPPLIQCCKKIIGLHWISQYILLLHFYYLPPTVLMCCYITLFPVLRYRFILPKNMQIKCFFVLCRWLDRHLTFIWDKRCNIYFCRMCSVPAAIIPNLRLVEELCKHWGFQVQKTTCIS